MLNDGLKEAIQAERTRIASDERAFVALDSLVTENRNELARAEAQIRRINEQLEGVAASASLTSVSWKRQIEQIQSRVAVAAVALLELEREIREVNLAASRSRLELLQDSLSSPVRTPDLHRKIWTRCSRVLKPSACGWNRNWRTPRVSTAMLVRLWTLPGSC